MICSVKQSVITPTINGSDTIFRRKNPSTIQRSLILPSLNGSKSSNPVLSMSKPLHVSRVESFALSKPQKRSLITCKAYEADRSEPIEAPEVKSEAAKKVKIGIYFATWWALNVVFNIYNKKVLNAFPYPWLTSTLSLACGSLMMLISWATRIAEAPKTDFEFWKTLFPVAVAHTIGHVAATVSMSKVAVSFTHIIKSGEPAFSVLVSRFLLGEAFPSSVYLSLVPIIGGCALAAVTELNFNMNYELDWLSVPGFMGAMISNLAFVFRNIFSKKGMKGKSVSGMNYYACLSMLSLLILTPFAIAVEGPQMWAAGWQTALSEIGPHFVWWIAAQSVFYHLYNQVSYMSLDEISPLTFSVGNTMKRISVIVSSIIIFHTPVQPVNALGAAIAVLGTFLYSQVPIIFISFCEDNVFNLFLGKAVIAPDLANFMTHVMYDERTSMSTAGDLQIRVAVCQ
uniref:Sugar phosphate transporter domain-containing protein n=1 Tax=Salix viminalis TaxID=40686 RepID=A0A6N2L1Q6_SALVM